LKIQQIFVVILSTLIVLKFGYCREIRSISDIPLDKDLSQFKSEIADQIAPPDSATAYQEIKDIQYQLDDIANIRLQPSIVAPAIENIKEICNEEFYFDSPNFCSENISPANLKLWYERNVKTLKGNMESVMRQIGYRGENLELTAPTISEDENCISYKAKLEEALKKHKKSVLEKMSHYKKIEDEKLNNIPEVSEYLDNRKHFLEKEVEIARKRGEIATANSIADKFWVIFLVLGGVAITILIVVRFFPEKSQLELVQSGQVIQFITVLLLLTVIMALGLSGSIKENTLGTLLGGLAGYVLSQGVGRAAENAARRVAAQDTTLIKPKKDNI